MQHPGHIYYSSSKLFVISDTMSMCIFGEGCLLIATICCFDVSMNSLRALSKTCIWYGKKWANGQISCTFFTTPFLLPVFTAAVSAMIIYILFCSWNSSMHEQTAINIDWADLSTRRAFKAVVRTMSDTDKQIAMNSVDFPRKLIVFPLKYRHQELLVEHKSCKSARSLWLENKLINVDCYSN